MEYSIQSAALFNPSIVPHPNQSGIPDGAVRVLMSLRATGEGHISSVVFRSGVIEADHTIHFDLPQEQARIAKEAKAEQEKAEQARLKAIQDKQDQVLLLTFSSEEEIEHARDNRMQVIDSVIGLIESSIATTRTKLDPLKKNADGNYISQGKEVPGGLAQKIEHFERKIEIRNAQLQAKVEEKEKIRQKYELDLDRFRNLRSASNGISQ